MFTTACSMMSVLSFFPNRVPLRAVSGGTHRERPLPPKHGLMLGCSLSLKQREAR